MSDDSSATNAILLLALTGVGSYYAYKSFIETKPVDMTPPTAISTTGIVATNFAKPVDEWSARAAAYQAEAWARSDGSNKDYGIKMKQVYHEHGIKGF